MLVAEATENVLKNELVLLNTAFGAVEAVSVLKNCWRVLKTADGLVEADSVLKNELILLSVTLTVVEDTRV